MPARHARLRVRVSASKRALSAWEPLLVVGGRAHRTDVSQDLLDDLQIPKIRQGSYFPSFLQPRKRSEQALVSVVQQAYVCGVSTRRVDQLVESLGLRISKSGRWGGRRAASPACPCRPKLGARGGPPRLQCRHYCARQRRCVLRSRCGVRRSLVGRRGHATASRGVRLRAESCACVKAAVGAPTRRNRAPRAS